MNKGGLRKTMCIDQNGTQRRERERKQHEDDITVSEFLSAISETEYPQYVLDAIEKIREWMEDTIIKPDNFDESDIFAAIFGDALDDEPNGIGGLFERLNEIEEFADVLPNSKMPDGKPDTIIISITPPDYESGLRTAIDYAAVFNRPNCRRVWIISDTFIFDEVIKFAPHVDALASQGIILRFILVTPWGWVELPLSGNMASKRQFMFRTHDEKEDRAKRRRRKYKEGE